MGDPAAALATLQEAEQFVDGERFPRQLLVLRFNLLVVLCLLGRASEAEPLLPEVHALATRLGNALDLVRFRWLEGRVHFGCGRHGEAIAALVEVRGAFAEREIAYDCALVTLELAGFHLEVGDTAAARRLAAEAHPIFEMQGVGRETLMTLRVFVEAAERDALTLALVRQLVRELETGQR